MNQDNGFVEPANFGTSDIACHKSAKTTTRSVSANAGDTLTVYWNTWPESHKGPINNYLAPVSSEYLHAEIPVPQYPLQDQSH